MAIAIVPARGGSKRIPRKNVREFLGKPILQTTLEQIQNSKYFTEVIVSTDDQEISSLARSAGVRVLSRSADLGGDFVTTLEVISNAVSMLSLGESGQQEIVVCIYPVTPLLDFSHVIEAGKILENEEDCFVFAAQELTQVNRGFYFDESERLQMLFPTNENLRTQDLPKMFCDAGLFYAGHAQTWLSGKSIFSPGSKVVKIGKYESIDIDTESDWNFAEELYRIRKENR